VREILLDVLAVFDVDGVVADVRHRLHHVARRPKNWAGFFAGAAADPPLWVGIDLARMWASEHDLVWLTGRPEYLRAVTEDWLVTHDLPVDSLLMRPPHDQRPARLYKADRLAKLARDADIAVVVDDDPEVFAELTARGFPVYLADWVPYAEALRAAQERDGRT
jgi:phosphoglycolate phosphatase-like HAD superfamily hydrolase